MCVTVWLIVLVILPCALAEDDRVLGGIFYQDAEELKETFTLSGNLFGFKTSIKEVERDGDILVITSSVCELAEEGVLGIIDGVGGRATENIQALCDTLELPHVVIEHNDLISRNWSLLSMFPSASVYNLALKDFIQHKEWQNFTILYSKGHSILKVSDLMMIGNTTDRYTITVRELGGDDYRDTLIEAKDKGYTNFVVDCPSVNLEQLLCHAQQAGLMADEYSYIFVSPDLFTLDMETYRYSGVNMTGFRIVNSDNKDDLWNFTAELNIHINNNEGSEDDQEAEEEIGDEGYKILPEQLKANVLLVYDAVKIFSNALNKINTTIAPKQLSCDTYESWVYGSTLLNFMKTNKIDGVTGPLLFDGMGQRSQVYFDILEVTSSGNQTIGQWKVENELNMSRPFSPDAEIGEESILKNKTLKVLISTTAPYGYEKKAKKNLVGNDRYEGFTIDLIHRLSEILGFSYVFEVENKYGNKDEHGKFNGMVRKLIDEEADLAICDFTMTSERQSGIDFSTPFMTVGIGILYKQPSKQPPAMFSFMAVFSKEVWINMLLIQLGLGVIMIIVGRISNKEWQNPVPCIEQPEELSNQFSFANSVWLIIGSVMQQGSEIAPIALAPRMITSIWWFFTLVMVASYVGTLVAFLIIEKNVMPFETVDELYHHKSIMYGAKNKGSTIDFFRYSAKKEYRDMYNKMLNNKWLVHDNDVGVLRAENSTYAFFMESSSIEYTTERHCDLLQVGDLLDSKSYGIGMKKKSPFKKYIDDALLKIKESGEIQKMKNVWWKEKYGGGKCGEKQDEDPNQLGMKNMLGAFVVLGGGCLIGFFISTLDMLWGVFKRSLKYGTTFKYELIEELKFAIKFSGNLKPVKRKTKTIDGSDEAFAMAEGKDEILSLPSIKTSRSGRSTSSNKTCHSHSSKHSSKSLAVAFARRRKYS